MLFAELQGLPGWNASQLSYLEFVEQYTRFNYLEWVAQRLGLKLFDFQRVTVEQDAIYICVEICSETEDFMMTIRQKVLLFNESKIDVKNLSEWLL